MHHSFVLNVDIDHYIDMGYQIRLHRWRIRVQGPTSTINQLRKSCPKFAAPDHTEPPAVSIAEATVDNLLRLWKPTLLWACGVFKCLLIAGAGPNVKCPVWIQNKIQLGFNDANKIRSVITCPCWTACISLRLRSTSSSPVKGRGGNCEPVKICDDSQLQS